MSFWKYCNCAGGNRELPWPNAEEILTGALICADCLKEHEVDAEDKDRLLVEMHTELQTLKKTVSVLTRAVKAIAGKVK